MPTGLFALDEAVTHDVARDQRLAVKVAAMSKAVALPRLRLEGLPGFAPASAMAWDRAAASAQAWETALALAGQLGLPPVQPVQQRETPAHPSIQPSSCPLVT